MCHNPGALFGMLPVTPCNFASRLSSRWLWKHIRCCTCREGILLSRLGPEVTSC